MFVKFLVVFALLGAVLFSADANANVEEDNSHAEHILKFLSKSHGTFSKKQALTIKNEAAKTKLNNHAKQGKSLKGYPNPENGYFISRVRPNADCSGNVISEAVVSTGVCRSIDYGWSYRTTCEHEENGTVPLLLTLFESPDCAPNTDWYSENINEVGNKCRFNPQNITTMGYQTTASQCSREPVHTTKPGMLQTLHDGDQCSGPAFGYNNRIFDACQLYVDYHASADFGVPDAKTRFWYMKLVSCEPNGKVLVHLFSDPACTRAKYRTTLDLHKGQHEHTCMYDVVDEVSSSFSCSHEH